MFAIVCSFAPAAAANTTIQNVEGYSLDRDGDLIRFSYLVVDGEGRVAEIGTTDPPLTDDLVDGDGAVLLPGLVDAHGHVLELGLKHARLDLTGSSSRQDALARLSAYSAANPDLPWIIGFGWNQELWPDKVFPTARDMDAVEPDRPVFLERIDGHAAWVNGAALRIANLKALSPDPEGGSILRDANGAPTGILIDRAMDLVSQFLPTPSDQTVDEALRRAFTALTSNGLTAVHDAGVSTSLVDIYSELADSGNLPIRIYAMLDGMRAFRAYGSPRTIADDRLIVRSVKLFADGALGSRGAALTQDYADDPGNTGLLMADSGTLSDWTLEARARGYQVNVHAIGDAANRTVLDAFVTAGIEPRDRHRIEHAQVLRNVDILRFSERGVIASMQPVHASSDRSMALTRLAPEMLSGAYAWGQLIRSGAVIAAGSDFPVESPNPFHTWHAFVSGAEAGWKKGEALSRTQAFRAMTLDAAFAAHMDKTTGTLEVGKWADFILVDRDPFTAPVDDIRNVVVQATWVGGNQVYPKPPDEDVLVH